MPMYNAPVITVEVGYPEGSARKVRYTLTGTDHQAISRALEQLGLVFAYVEQRTQVMIFRGPNGLRGWYTQVTDHNPTEDQ